MTVLSQKIESAFSRVANGNFSNYLSYWEPIENLQVITERGTGPAEPHNRCRATGSFKHIVQYRDLGVYPSVFCFRGGALVPVSMSGSFVYGLQPIFTAPNIQQALYPFAYRDATGTYGSLKPLPIGSWLMVDSLHAETCGEFRLSHITSNTRALITRVSGREPVLAGSPIRAEYSTVSPTVVMIRLDRDISTVKRLDGTTGVRMSDGFAARGPDFGGTVTGWAGNILYVNLTSPYSKVPPDTGGPTLFRIIKEWQLAEWESVSVTRSAPSVAYDLTLAYTLKDGAAMNPAAVWINCVRENGSYDGAFYPVALSGTNLYLSYSLNNGYTRYIQRFVREREIPFYGQFEINFPQPGTSSVSEIADVVLYRGNFTDKFLVNDRSSTEVYDLLEAPIAVESEIIPRGTIIAYTGGGVCPSGFIRVEGIGREEHNMVDPFVLYNRWSRMSDEYSSHEIIYPVSSDEPRTLIHLTGHHSLAIEGESLPFQTHGEYWDIVPFTSDDPNVAQIRTEIGNPLPIWLNDTFNRVMVVPGYVLEIRIPDGTSYKSAYAIITQYAEGKKVTGVVEEQPAEVFFHNGEERRHAEWQVHELGKDRNEVYQAYGAYGNFQISYQYIYQMELLGDWDKLITDAVAKNADLVIWKAGVLAHSQVLPELGAGTDGKGGLSYFGEPHAHDMPEGDVPSTVDVGRPHVDMRLPTKHFHGYTFGAVTLPKVRPVLLCQKV